MAHYLHDDLRPVLEETCGVVVFHEQVIRMVDVFTGCGLAEADEVRRTLGSPDGQAEVREWFYPQAMRRGYSLEVVEQVWEVLKAFASFGFCKAHAAAFALPTYQSAWLKAHHPAAFLAGVLTHDPGMYPKRLILDDARQLGIAILGLDVNASDEVYRVEPVAPWDAPPPGILGAAPREAPDAARARPTAGPTASGWRWPRSRASPAPRSPAPSPVGPTPRSPTSGTAPGSPARSSSGSSWPGPSTASTASGRWCRCAVAGRSPAATSSCRSPSSTAGAGPSTGVPGGVLRRARAAPGSTPLAVDASGIDASGISGTRRAAVPGRGGRTPSGHAARPRPRRRP